MAEKVRVFCNVPNGLTLRVFKPFNDGTGAPPQMVPVGDAVTIGGPMSPGHDFSADQFVMTEIESGFWNTWLEQNKGNELLASRSLHAEQDEEKREDWRE